MSNNDQDQGEWPAGGASAGLAGSESVGPTPTIGRMVRYIDEEGQELAAVISAVHSVDCVNLRVFTNSVEFPLVTSIPHGSVSDRGPHWLWPTIR